MCLIILSTAIAADGAPPPRTPPVRNFLSATLGSGMVLQRAPQRAVLWGFTGNASGVVVTTKLDGVAMTTTSDATGTWRQALPATEASVSRAHTITVTASNGMRAALSNVLFGDVYLCGGQSNVRRPPARSPALLAAPC